MLDLDALVRDRGPDYDWKKLRAVCAECHNRNTSISLRWTLSDMTYSHHGSATPGGSMIGHNGAPRAPVKVLKKRRRKKSSFTRKPGDPG